MALTAWIWWFSGGAVALAGLVMLWWALFHDRARGRRRCPKCWYDMAGVPDLVCPECGRDARRERNLTKTKRWWRRGLLASFVIVFGSGVVAYPKAARDGWLSFVPTTVLIGIAPPAGKAYTRDSSGYWTLSPIVAELKRRNLQESLSDWQWSWYVHHKEVVVLPKRWPAETPLQVVMHAPEWLPGVQIQIQDDAEGDVVGQVGLTEHDMSVSGFSMDGNRRLPTSLEHSREVVLQVRIIEQEAGLFWWTSPPERVLWSGTVTQQVLSVTDALDMFEILEGPAWDEQVQAHMTLGLDVHLNTGEQRSSVRCSWSIDRSAGSGLEELGIGLEIQLCLDGEVRSSVLVCAPQTDRYEETRARMEGVESLYPSRLASLISDDSSGWTLRVVGRPDQAVGGFWQSKAWSGSFELPVTDVLKIHSH